MFFQDLLNPPLLAVLATLLVVALCYELPTKKIPNWISLGGLIAGLVVASLDQQWGIHLLGMVVALMLGIVFFAKGWLGGGFVKLLTAVGLILGPMVTVTTILIVCVLLAYLRLTQGNDTPNEVLYESERPKHATFTGSVIISIGAVAAILFML